MLSPTILLTAVLNGLMTGAVYALVALGLTLIYGVLHIINFAHGALLTVALFAVYFAYKIFGLDPYVAVFAIAPLFFAFGYGLQRFVIGPAAHGAILSAAMFGAYFAWVMGVDPYVAVIGLAPAFFAIGYCVQRFVSIEARCASARLLRGAMRAFTPIYDGLWLVIGPATSGRTRWLAMTTAFSQ